MSESKPASGAPRLSRRQALRITAVSGLSVAFGGSIVAGLVERARLQRVRETRSRLGTLVTVTAVHPEADGARAMVDAAFAEIDRLEAILSRHRPDTPLARLNSEGVAHGVPVEMIEVLRRAEEYAELTDGAFDVTVAPVLNLYAARHASGRPPPSPEEVRPVLELVGYQGVSIDDRTVRLARPGMGVTLDGIAKGFVVDRTVASLVAAGAERVLIDAGGDMASGGIGVGDEPWTIGIQDPHRNRGSLGRVRLAGDAVATSGDYMQSFTQDRRFHHIIDPRTGHSPDHTSAATVVAATAMDADALSTAVMVLGLDQGAALLERLPRVEGLIVSKDGEERRSSGMSRVG
jgi:thiamine biosynthesis lipoprotein